MSMAFYLKKALDEEKRIKNQVDAVQRSLSLDGHRRSLHPQSNTRADHNNIHEPFEPQPVYYVAGENSERVIRSQYKKCHARLVSMLQRFHALLDFSYPLLQRNNVLRIISCVLSAR